MHNRIRIVFLVSLIGLIVSCASTKSSSVKNPAYTSFILANPAVLVVDGGLDFSLKVEKEVIKQLKENGVNARGITGVIQFLETDEDWKNFNKKLYDEGVREIIFVSTIENTNLSTYAYKTNTTYNNGVSVNGVNYVKPSSSSTTTPIMAIRKNMSMSMKIDEFDSGKSIWKGNAINNSQGLLYTGEQTMISNTVKEMIKALKKDSLLE